MKTRALIARVAVLFGAIVFAGGSALVYFVPARDTTATAETPEPSPTLHVDLSLPTVDPLPAFKPTPTKAKPSATPKPKTSTSASPSSSPSAVRPSRRDDPSPRSSSPAPVTPTPEPTTAKPTPTPTPTPSAVPVPDNRVPRAQVIALINQQRASYGYSQLVSSSALSDQCQSWANHLATRGVLAHSGHPYGGEILAREAFSASQAVDMWMNSPDHRRILLDPDYRSIGSGTVDGYWVVHFS